MYFLSLEKKKEKKEICKIRILYELNDYQLPYYIKISRQVFNGPEINTNKWPGVSFGVSAN